MPLKYFVATTHVDIDDTRFGYGVFWSYDTAAGAARTTRPIVYLDKNIDIFYDEETGIYRVTKE